MTQENKTAQKSDENCLCFWEEGRLWERMVPTGDILEISIPRLRQAVEESYDELMHMIAVVQQICENPCYAVSSGILERFLTENVKKEKLQKDSGTTVSEDGSTGKRILFLPMSIFPMQMPGGQ